MLKAVRFDESKHKSLLDFVTDYRDSKGKQNESEAIRFLMQAGLDAINNTPINIPVQQTPKSAASEINMESLKKELMNDIMAQMNVQVLNQVLSKLDNVQPAARAFTKVNSSVEVEPIEITTLKPVEEVKPVTPIQNKKPIDIPANTNPLLANLLANAKR